MNPAALHKRGKLGRHWPVGMAFLLGLTAVARAQTTASPVTLPPLPAMRSPIDYFRELLATNEAGRAQMLAQKTPAQRQSIQAKLAQYLALSPEQRELRLTLTELRWYLLPLLQEPATHRAPALSQAPAQYRPLLEERLRQWDKLAPDLQQLFLKNEAALQVILRFTNSTPPQKRAWLATLPPEQRKKIEADFEAWRALSPEQQDTITAQFNQVFALNEKEKERVLSVLPALERQRMEKTLAAFAQLPKEEREYCIAAFGKFAGMNPGERDQFLQNAARWVEMTPAERQQWRELIRYLRAPEVLPPLPPGLVPFPLNSVVTSATNEPR